MTRVLMNALGGAGIETRLIDRRFSRSIGEVGRPSLKKILAVPALLLRAATAGRRGSICVYFGTTSLGSSAVDLLAILTLRLRGVSIINYVHTVGYITLAAGPLGRMIVRLTFANIARVVCLGPALAKDVQPWVNPEQISCIENVSEEPREDKNDVDAPASISGLGDFVLFLSNLIPSKGPAVFLEAAAVLINKHDSLNFVVAGAAPNERTLEDLQRYAATLGLGERVHFTGAVHGSTKWALLSRAKVLVFPSTYPSEAQPLTIVEAKSVGLPVIAFNSGGIPDLLRDSPGSRAVPSGDITQLVDGVSAAVRSQVTRRPGNYTALRERYVASWTTVIDQVQQLRRLQ